MRKSSLLWVTGGDPAGTSIRTTRSKSSTVRSCRVPQPLPREAAAGLGAPSPSELPEAESPVAARQTVNPRECDRAENLGDPVCVGELPDPWPVVEARTVGDEAVAEFLEPFGISGPQIGVLEQRLADFICSTASSRRGAAPAVVVIGLRPSTGVASGKATRFSRRPRPSCRLLNSAGSWRGVLTQRDSDAVGPTVVPLWIDDSDVLLLLRSPRRPWAAPRLQRMAPTRSPSREPSVARCRVGRAMGTHRTNP